jgi:hypothetical protein
MKIKNLFLPALATLFIFSSCTKETVKTVIQEPTPALEGVYDGYYGSKSINGSDTTYTNPTIGYSMIIKANGAATVYGTSLADSSSINRAEGTWVYSTDGKITVDYTYIGGGPRYIIRANVDSKFRSINGKWHNTDNTVGGLFYMVKK